MRSPEPHSPPVLYHYTTAHGLIGIVRNGALWASDAEFLNDAEELRFGRREMHEALLSRAAELSPEDSTTHGAEYSRATIMRSAAGHLEPGGMFASRQYHVVYLVCFCEDGDLLSQWRGYAPSGGFAIGFSTAGLRAVKPPTARPWKIVGSDDSVSEDISEPSSPPPLPVRLVKVEYGPMAMRRAIEGVLEEVAPLPKGHPGSTGFFRAQTIVMPALASIKHDAFADEREWRLIMVGSSGHERVSFRTGQFGVHPYAEVPIDLEAIEEVVIGPGAEAALRRRGVERLLAEHGVENARLRESRAPFRG
jgi:hypothetical protein